jgi:polyphosphate glucokinase
MATPTERTDTGIANSYGEGDAAHRMNALGIDIGGSSVKGAPVNTKTGKLLAERHRIATPRHLSPVMMARVVAEIAQHFQWRGLIGTGFPGVIQGPHIMTSANLHPGFIGCDAVKLFGKSTGCRVALINDAAAAALAEMRFGAGRGFKGKTLLLTLGTGVGTALAHGGVVTPCELGHLVWKGNSAEKFVAVSARDREELSWEVWGRRLGKYIRDLEALLWPERIIIGGGVSAKHHKFFPHVETRAKLVPAKLLNRAGIVGAALWAVHSR